MLKFHDVGGGGGSSISNGGELSGELVTVECDTAAYCSYCSCVKFSSCVFCVCCSCSSSSTSSSCSKSSNVVVVADVCLRVDVRCHYDTAVVYVCIVVMLVEVIVVDCSSRCTEVGVCTSWSISL